jgi:hypothetical protein
MAVFTIVRVVAACWLIVIGFAAADHERVRMGDMADHWFYAGEVAHGRRHDGEPRIQCTGDNCTDITMVYCVNRKVGAERKPHGKWDCFAHGKTVMAVG